MKKQLIIYLLTLCALMNTYGEIVSLTVDEAAEMAVENNLSLKSSAVDVRTKARTRDTAWNVFLPSINASADLSHSRTLLSDPTPSPMAPEAYDPAWSLTSTLSMTLPLNIAAGTGIKQTIIDYEAGDLTYRDAKKKLVRDVRKQFYNMIALAANIDLKKVNIEIAEKRYEQSRENYNNGLISELEMLQSQVTVENMKPELNALNTRFENGLMNFKFLLGIPLDTEIFLMGDLNNIRFYDLNKDSLIDSYSAGRMDIMQLNKSIESLRNSKKASAQLNRTPSVSLYSTWRNPVSDPFEGESWESGSWIDSMTFGVQLSMPLDDFIPNSSTDVSLKEMDDSIEKLELQRQQLYEAASMEITNLVMNLENSYRTIETYELNVDLAQKSFDLTTEAYNLGTRELLDVETAQESLLTASQSVLFEKINYISNLLDLQYAINTDDLSKILEEK